MIVGIPKEIKDDEYRVSQIPAGVQVLTEAGHRILVEQGAGEPSGFRDDDYLKAGAELVTDGAEVFSKSEMVLKVKEPQEAEYEFCHPGLILFTFLHLASAERLTHILLERQVTGIAYEAVELPDGSLPLLTPMSEIAGKMAVQVGSHYLEKIHGGSGVLLGGVPGVPPCKVVIIGGGTAGINSAQIALGMGASVTILDSETRRLRYLNEALHGRFETQVSNPTNIGAAVKEANLIIGTVLIHGAKAPCVVTKEMVKSMKPGSVIIDLAIDQGGCVETSQPTTLSNPTYIADGVVHYCVANIPSLVTRTSTYALAYETLPYVLKLAALGFPKAAESDAALAKGVNVYAGHITNNAIAKSLGLPYKPLSELLNA